MRRTCLRFLRLLFLLPDLPALACTLQHLAAVQESCAPFPLIADQLHAMCRKRGSTPSPRPTPPLVFHPVFFSFVTKLHLIRSSFLCSDLAQELARGQRFGPVQDTNLLDLLRQVVLFCAHFPLSSQVICPSFFSKCIVDSLLTLTHTLCVLLLFASCVCGFVGWPCVCACVCLLLIVSS